MVSGTPGTGSTGITTRQASPHLFNTPARDSITSVNTPVGEVLWSHSVTRAARYYVFFRTSSNGSEPSFDVIDTDRHTKLLLVRTDSSYARTSANSAAGNSATRMKYSRIYRVFRGAHFES